MKTTTTAGFLRQNAPWLGAGFLLTFCSSFGQTFFIAIFAADIRLEFGLSNGGWGAVYAVGTMASAGVMVFAGGVTDRFRVRLIGPGVMVLLVVACALMAFAASLWALVVAVFLLRFLGQGMMSHTAMVAISRWFVGNRGRAIAIAGLGVALGEAMLPITFVGLKGWVDWRWLWLGVAVVVACAAVGLVPMLRHERTPQAISRDAQSTGMLGRTWTRVQALRHWLFWLCLPMLLAPAAWNTAFFFHQVHFAEAKGWAHFDLVTLLPLFTLATVGGAVLAGLLVDRFGAPRMNGVHFAPVVLGYLVLGAADGLAVAAVGLFLVGAGAGLHQTLATALWAEVYGTANLGRIRAMTGAVMVLGTALGPGLCGWLIDLGLDMPEQTYGFSLFFLVAGVLAALGARRAARLI